MKTPLTSMMLTTLIVLLITTAPVLPASAADHTVGRGGTYATINKAVSAANPGDTIIVAPGTYVENVLVNKPLTIRSSHGAPLTTIQAAVPGKDVFLLTGTDIRVDGFTIVGQMGGSGVKLDHASQCVITNNLVYGNIRGVLLYSTTRSEVSNNNVSNNGYGVYLDGSSDNTVTNNVAMYEKGFGMYLGDGIFMNGSPHNTVTRNVLSYNHMFGISLWDSTENAILGNVINANEQFGVRLRSSSGNTLAFNTISATAQDGIYIGYSSGNKIYCNNFVSNPNNINNPQGNIFGSPQRLAYTYNGQDYVGYMGNYYSDYRGTDREGNGIGDTVYPIGDSYPLVKPVAQYEPIRSEPTSTQTSTANSTDTNHNSSTQSDQHAESTAKVPGFEIGYAILGATMAALIVLKRGHLW